MITGGGGYGGGVLRNPVVGFDLDMTLVDSAAGIVATLTSVLAGMPGVPTPEPEQIWPWIGLPLNETVHALAPGADADEVVRRYRAEYAAIGAARTVLLPGAAGAIAAVKDAGGRVLVISAKAQAGVWEVLRAVELDSGPLKPDVVVGDLFAGAKGVRLKADGAHAYVGDHPADVEAARVAQAYAVGVATGPRTAGDLHEAGADVVLADLRDFPAWLAGWLETGGAASGPRPNQDARRESDDR